MSRCVIPAVCTECRHSATSCSMSRTAGKGRLTLSHLQSHTNVREAPGGGLSLKQSFLCNTGRENSARRRRNSGGALGQGGPSLEDHVWWECGPAP